MSNQDILNQLDQIIADMQGASVVCADAGLNGTSAEFEKTMLELHEVRAEIERLRDPWVSVDERLPELKTEVLCCYRIGSDTFTKVAWIEGQLDGYWGWYAYDETRGDWEAFQGSSDVTHWMPIPTRGEG